jgi:hypothetical protein
MCGFSQESYNRIHKLEFEQVKRNIFSLVSVAKEAGYNTRRIVIAYHVYQFNTTEVSAMQDFADSLNISSYPYYAFINDPKLFRQYGDGILDVQNWNEISQDIFLYHLRKRMDNHPHNRCTQFDYLTIDEQCNVLPCCCLERDHKSYTFTNVLHKNFIEKLQNWQPDAYCSICMNKGLSPLGGILEAVPFEFRQRNPIDYSGTELLKVLWQKVKKRIAGRKK